jgi:hypothetical protein
MLWPLRRPLLALILLLGLPAVAQAGPPRSAIFFYPWYSNVRHDGGYSHWTQGGHQPPFDLASQFYPARGAYSSSDPRVLREQMRDIAIAGVDEVVNVTPFLQGRDGETDDQLRARAKAYIVSLARCGYRAIEFAAVGISDGTREVVFARAFPNPLRRGDVNLFIDDGTGTAESSVPIADELVTTGLLGPPADRAVGGEEFLSLDFPPVRLESGYEVRVNGSVRNNDSTVFLSPTDGVLRFAPGLATGDEVRADYTRYTGLIPEVQRAISGVRGDPRFPGWGAAGVRIRVRAPRILSPQIAGTLFLAEGTDRETAVRLAESSTVRLVNSGGISDDVVLAQIVEAVMGVPGVTDFVLETPVENVVVLDDELARSTLADVDYD